MSPSSPFPRSPGARRAARLGPLVLAGTAALVALLSASPAAAVDRRAEAAAKTAIKKAGNDYLATNYDAAATRLQKAVRLCGAKKCTPGTRAALLRDLGTMQFRNGDVGAAKKTWANALQIQADLTLNPDYDTPDLRAAFEEARGGTGAGAMGEQPSGDFAHTPAGEQKVNTPLPVYVEYPGSGGVVRVVIKYKGAAMSDWGRVDLKHAGPGWGGLIPCTAVTKGVMRYWVQGFDDGGDPVGSSGDPKHPYTVTIKDDIDGDPPHLPGQSAPKSCGEDTECPPGLPGCAAEEETKTTETPSDEEAQEKPPPGAYVHWWFGLTGALDFISMPAAQGACLLTPGAAPANSQGYYCTNPDGSDFPSRTNTTQNVQLQKSGQAGNVAGGLQPGNVRVMFSFDYALTPSFLVGARGGYVANAYTGQAAVKDGKAFSADIDLEARATYLFGDHPLANVGFAPMLFAGAGVSEFDGHTTTIVTLVSQQPANAWITNGPFFFLVGGGARYAFSPRAAFSLAVRLNGAVGNGLLATYGPEVGIQYGF